MKINHRIFAIEEKTHAQPCPQFISFKVSLIIFVQISAFIGININHRIGKSLMKVMFSAN